MNLLESNPKNSRFVGCILAVLVACRISFSPVVQVWWSAVMRLTRMHVNEIRKCDLIRNTSSPITRFCSEAGGPRHPCSRRQLPLAAHNSFRGWARKDASVALGARCGSRHRIARAALQRTFEPPRPWRSGLLRASLACAAASAGRENTFLKQALF